MDRPLRHSVCSIVGKMLLEFNTGFGVRWRILVLSSHQGQFINCSNLTPSIASTFFLFSVTSQTNSSNKLITHAVSTYSVPIKYGNSTISHSKLNHIWLKSLYTSILQHLLNYFLSSYFTFKLHLTALNDDLFNTYIFHSTNTYWVSTMWHLVYILSGIYIRHESSDWNK